MDVPPPQVQVAQTEQRQVVAMPSPFSLTHEEQVKLKKILEEFGSGKEPELQLKFEPNYLVLLVGGLSLVFLRKFIEEFAAHVEAIFWELTLGKKAEKRDQSEGVGQDTAASPEYTRFRSLIEMHARLTAAILKTKTKQATVVRYYFEEASIDNPLEVKLPQSVTEEVGLGATIDMSLLRFTLADVGNRSDSKMQMATLRRDFEQVTQRKLTLADFVLYLNIIETPPHLAPPHLTIPHLTTPMLKPALASPLFSADQK